MQGTVGDHLHVAAPAVEGTDHAPGARLRVSGIRVLLLGNALDDLGLGAVGIQDEVVLAGLGDDDVGTVLAHGEFLAQRVGLDALGITEVHVPATVLAELDLRTGLELDALRHVQGTVGPHLVVIGPAVERADQAPGTLLGVTGIRIAGREEDLVFGNLDLALGFDIAVAAVVAGLLLHGSADHHLQGHLGPFLIAQGDERLAQVGGGDGDDIVLDRGGQGHVHGIAVDGGQQQPVVQGHLLVEILVQHTRGKSSRDAVVGQLVIRDHRRSGLRRIKDRQRLLDAGYGGERHQTCSKDGYNFLHKADYLLEVE